MGLGFFKKEQKQTATSGIASWSEFPKLEKFWDAYVDIFWGDGGNTSFHDMLMADIEWLKKAYFENDDILKKLEEKFMTTVRATQGKYERNIEESRIPISMNGKVLANMVPPGEDKTQTTLRESRLGTAGLLHATQAGAAARLLGGRQEFTPNKGNLEYLKTLRDEGTLGMNLRAKLPTLTSMTSDSPSTAGALSGGADMLGGVIDLIGSLGDSGLWGAVKDWGLDFWGWLT